MDSALPSRVSPEGARLGPPVSAGKRKALPITEELTILIKLIYILDSKFFFPFFRKYFKEACNVPEPEEKFNMDKYTDVVTVSKPVIYISIEEIINTHSVSEAGGGSEQWTRGSGINLENV